MAKTKLTDEEVMAEIERLKDNPYVKSAQKEVAKKARQKVDPMRKKLYQLRWLEKRGRELCQEVLSYE